MSLKKSGISTFFIILSNGYIYGISFNDSFNY